MTFTKEDVKTLLLWCNFEFDCYESQTHNNDKCPLLTDRLLRYAHRRAGIFSISLELMDIVNEVDWEIKNRIKKQIY